MSPPLRGARPARESRGPRRLRRHAANPRQCRAPDAAIKLGLAQATLLQHPSWKTWELGVPELVVEVLSLSDARERWTLDEKREAYERIGVSEFVVFDLDQPEGKRLHVWARVDGDFVERIVDGERTPCVTLSNALASPIEWLVAPIHHHRAALRLANAGLLVPTDRERALAAETQRLAAEQRATAAEIVAAEATARTDAQAARIAELEAALAAARGDRSGT